MNTYLNLNNFYKIEEDEKKLTLKFHFSFSNNEDKIIWIADNKKEYIETLLRFKTAIEINSYWFLLDKN